jgi:hypothetical protein
MEKITGYVLLAIGLILIIVAASLVISIFLNGIRIPQLVQISTATSDFVQAVATFSNVCLMFFIFTIIVWAGSIISSRGVTMIKDVRLKLVRKSLEEATETISKEEAKEA